MKKLFYLYAAMLAILAGACSDDKDEPDTPAVQESTLSVSPSSLSMLSTQNAQVSFNIRSNTNWNITEVPDWLNLSAISGDGDTSITVTALSDNNSDEPRTAVIKITAVGNETKAEDGSITDEESDTDSGNNTLTCDLTITQMAKYQANCRVEFKDIFTLANSMCFELDVQSGVSYFYAGFLSASVGGWPDSKIIETMTQEGEKTYTPDEVKDRILGSNNVTPDTEYYLCAVAFDANGNQGPLTKTKIRSLKLPNNYPWVYIDDIDVSDNDVLAYFRKNQVTLGYYTLFTTDDYAIEIAMNWTAAQMAKVFKEYIDDGTCTLWPNDGWLTLDGKYTSVLITSWGMDALNQLSPVINYDFDSKYLSENERKINKKNKKSNGFVIVSKKEMKEMKQSVKVIKR